MSTQRETGVERRPSRTERRYDDAPEPTRQDLDDIVHTLEAGWTATVTVARRAANDVGYREIYVSVDGSSIGVLRHGEAITVDVSPGHHELRAHNTLFRRTVPFDVSVGEHAGFTAVNHAGRGTYSFLAVFIGVLGAGPLYLSLERDPSVTAPVRAQAADGGAPPR